MDDLPDPDTPVKMVILRFGICSDTFFRLFSRAPRMVMYSWDTFRSFSYRTIHLLTALPGQELSVFLDTVSLKSRLETIGAVNFRTGKYIPESCLSPKFSPQTGASESGGRN